MEFGRTLLKYLLTLYFFGAIIMIKSIKVLIVCVRNVQPGRFTIKRTRFTHVIVKYANNMSFMQCEVMYVVTDLQGRNPAATFPSATHFFHDICQQQIAKTTKSTKVSIKCCCFLGPLPCRRVSACPLSPWFHLVHPLVIWT